MIIPRVAHGLAVVDGQLWAVGGLGDEDRVTQALQSCEYLDVDANVWLPVPTDSLCCVAQQLRLVFDRVYFF